MEILKTSSIRKLDQQAIQTYHIASHELMEHAARALCEYMIEHVNRKTHVCILCGPGNNGGDGFALAYLMIRERYEHVIVYCCEPLEFMSEDEKIFAHLCVEQKVPILTTTNMDELKKVFQLQDVFVDGLFGTGLSRNIEGFYDGLITYVNSLHKKVISIDIASGIHSDSGKVMNCALKATTTITFECMKYGQVFYPGSAYCGEIVVKPIGLENLLARCLDEKTNIIDDALCAHFLPKRDAHGNKGSFGKVLMIGGSYAMPGAISLAAKSALRSGLGTLTLCVPDVIHDLLAMQIQECMFLSAKSSEGYYDEHIINLTKAQLASFEVVSIGNGLGRNNINEALVEMVLESECDCIVDGDALYELGKNIDLCKRHATTILTPHPKEMSYLCGKSVQEITADPVSIALEFCQKYPSVVLVLKDQHTTICYRDTCYMNIIGNDALAKGGSGDVLCGILTGLFAQGKNALRAACASVYVHALAADQLCSEQDTYSILPSDIIDKLSDVYKYIKSK